MDFAKTKTKKKEIFILFRAKISLLPFHAFIHSLFRWNVDDCLLPRIPSEGTKNNRETETGRPPTLRHQSRAGPGLLNAMTTLKSTAFVLTASPRFLFWIELKRAKRRILTHSTHTWCVASAAVNLKQAIRQTGRQVMKTEWAKTNKTRGNYKFLQDPS